MDRIVFIGTVGGVEGILKRVSRSSGFILEVENSKIIIDPGYGFLSKAMNYGYNLLFCDGVIVTHSHLDNCGDILAVNELLVQDKSKKRFFLASKSVLEGCETENYQSPARITRFQKEKYAEVKELLGKEFKWKDLKITGIPCKHGDPYTYGVKIVYPKLTLVYSSDTEFYHGLKDEYSGADILILNLSTPNMYRNKILKEHVIELAKSVKPEKIFLTGYNQVLLDYGIDKLGRELQKQVPEGVKIIIAKDLTSYDITLK